MSVPQAWQLVETLFQNVAVNRYSVSFWGDDGSLSFSQSPLLWGDWLSYDSIPVLTRTDSLQDRRTQHAPSLHPHVPTSSVGTPPNESDGSITAQCLLLPFMTSTNLPLPLPSPLILSGLQMCLPLCSWWGGVSPCLYLPGSLFYCPGLGGNPGARKDSRSLCGYTGVSCTSHLDAVGRLMARDTLSQGTSYETGEAALSLVLGQA